MGCAKALRRDRRERAPRPRPSWPCACTAPGLHWSAKGALILAFLTASAQTLTLDFG